jgi:hypothetical protein
VPIDEQEADPLVALGGEETSQQQGAVTADHEREMAVVEDRDDRIPDPSHQRDQSVSIDEVRHGVAFRRGVRKYHVTVVVHLRVAQERINQSDLSQGRGGASNAADRSRRVRRHTEKSDRSHLQPNLADRRANPPSAEASTGAGISS